MNHIDQELLGGLGALSDQALDRVIAHLVAGGEMKVDFGWHDWAFCDTNPMAADGTVACGCLVGISMAEDDFLADAELCSLGESLDSLHPLAVLAVKTFTKWVSFHQRGVELDDLLEPEVKEVLLGLLEMEYNRRHPMKEEVRDNTRSRDLVGV